MCIEQNTQKLIADEIYKKLDDEMLLSGYSQFETLIKFFVDNNLWEVTFSDNFKNITTMIPLVQMQSIITDFHGSYIN